MGVGLDDPSLKAELGESDRPGQMNPRNSERIFSGGRRSRPGTKNQRGKIAHEVEAPKNVDVDSRIEPEPVAANVLDLVALQ